jgi:hypothetical protein
MKLTKIIFLICALWFSGWPLYGQADRACVTLDLTQGLTIEKLRPLQVGFTEQHRQQPLFRAFEVTNTEIHMIFAGTASVRQFVTSAVMHFYDDNSLVIHTTGEYLLLQELTSVVHGFHKLAGENVDSYEVWSQTEGVKGKGGDKFRWRSKDTLPVAGYNIEPTFYDALPWKLEFWAHWTAPDQKSGLSSPFRNEGYINLNSPSNRRFIPQDALRLKNKRPRDNIAFLNEGHHQPVGDHHAEPAEEVVRNPMAEPLAKIDENWFWSKWLGPLLAVIAAIPLVILYKNYRRRIRI